MQFIELYERVKDYTMVEKERCFALYQSVNYIIKNNIRGDFAECGVWKGGSCMLIAFLLLELGVTDRSIYLYDTFEGMVQPGIMDGEAEKRTWEEMRDENGHNNWCFSSIELTMMNMRQTGYPEEKIKFVKGKVEETIPVTIPSGLALLRLDTDWYESTKHELVHLYPLLERKGVLIIDDYGAWTGARKAVDEYFSGKHAVFLHRLDWTGRLLIKD